MTARNMKLGKQPSKLNHDLILLENEKCIIEVAKGTLTLPILIDETAQGCFFAGKGRLTLDTIVETPEGAVGKPMNNDLTQPFLMFGETAPLSEALSPAIDEDFSKMGCNDLADFLVKANEAFSKFFSGGNRSIGLESKFEKRSIMFAFLNTHDKWDVLISKGDKIIYTSEGRVYISSDLDEDFETRSAHVLFARNGKTVVVGRHNVLVDYGEDRQTL